MNHTPCKVDIKTIQQRWVSVVKKVNCLCLRLIKKLINKTNKFILDLKLTFSFKAQWVSIHQAHWV